MDENKQHHEGQCSCGCDEHEHSHEENCGCGCEHDHEEGCDCGCGEGEALIVELEDENGNVVPCEIVESFDYKDNEYVLVQNPQDDSVYLFKVVGDDDEQGELVVPNDEEFAEVSSYYEGLLEKE